MRILREKSLSTKLLLLLEIMSEKPSKLTSLAEALNITPQAVSEYIKKLTEDEFVTQINGRYYATKEGVEFVHKQLKDLKRFTEDKIRFLDIIDKCIAIAGDEIEKGRRVGLFMEKGYLIAYPDRTSDSGGVALRDAKRGEDVPVGNLEGIVDHAMGRILIVHLHYSLENGSRDISIKKLKRTIDRLDYDKIAAGDIVSLSAAKKIDLEIDFEFAPVESTLEAVERGLSVLFLGSSDSINNILSSVGRFNTSYADKIEYSIVDI